jgi:cation diffusion facilitator family transporter
VIASSIQDRATPTEQIRKVTLAGLIVNLVLSALKGAVGFLGGSQALVADAVHSLSDCVTDLAVLVGVRFWSAPPDECHPHGHGRIETLISFFIGIALSVVALGITWNAFNSILSGQSVVPGWPAFFAALLSIGLKEWLFRWTIRVGRRVGSTALIANAWHHRSDALSSLPVALAVVVGRLYPTLIFLDQIAAIAVSIFLLKAAGNIALPSLGHLVDAGVDQEVRKALLGTVISTEGVRGLHALRTRYIGSGLSVDLHVQVDAEISVRDGHEIAGRVKARLMEGDHGIVDVLVHVEPFEGG